VNTAKVASLFVVKEIEKFNILQSSFTMQVNRALKKINIKDHIILVDGNFSPDKNKNIKTIVKGRSKMHVLLQQRL
jgi:ribonuclease HII